MISLVKVGYFLVGFGVGLMTNGFILDYELKRPIAEDQPILSPSNEPEKPERVSGPEKAKVGLRIDSEGSQGYSEGAKSVITSYSSIYDEQEKRITALEEENKKRAEAEHPVDDDEESMIFPITEDEYVDAKSMNYDKIPITYYEDDNTYADQTDTICSGFEDHIGTDPIEYDEDDMAYIRNENERTDYAIHKVEVGYVEAVLGIVDDDTVPDIRKEPRKMRKNEYD